MVKALEGKGSQSGKTSEPVRRSIILESLVIFCFYFWELRLTKHMSQCIISDCGQL